VNIAKRVVHVAYGTTAYQTSSFEYEAAACVYNLALVVNAKGHTAVSVVRKWGGSAVFPQHRQEDPIISRARLACGVHGTVFCKSYDLSTVVDRARLPPRTRKTVSCRMAATTAAGMRLAPIGPTGFHRISRSTAPQ